MKLKDFVFKYIGKSVDFDNAYGSQCVDLFRQYSKDVFNTPHTGSVEGAKDLWLNHSNLPVQQKYYKQIRKDFIQGDILIWDKSNTNKYGHVAILLDIRDKDLIVLEQNGFTQLGTEIKIRDYNNLLGALRYNYEY